MLRRRHAHRSAAPAFCDAGCAEIIRKATQGMALVVFYVKYASYHSFLTRVNSL